MHEESALPPYNSANIHARKKIKPVLESPECLLLGNISETCEFQIWKNGACLDQKSLWAVGHGWGSVGSIGPDLIIVDP